MKKKDGVFVTLFKDENRYEVFLVFRSDYPIWVQPGGGVELGETPEKAVTREAFEETGFKIKIVRKIGVYENIDPKSSDTENFVHLYEGRVISGTFKPEFSGCKGQWFNILKLPVDITDRTRERILDSVRLGGKVFYKRSHRAELIHNIHLVFRHPISSLKYITRRKLHYGI